MKIEQDVKFLQPCWNCGETILFGKLIPQLETCEICHGTRRVLTEAGEEMKELLEHLGVLQPEPTR
jgi:hypothetical protein